MEVPSNKGKAYDINDEGQLHGTRDIGYITLQSRHESTADNGHHDDGASRFRVFLFHSIQRAGINRCPAGAKEEAGKDCTIESCHARSKGHHEDIQHTDSSIESQNLVGREFRHQEVGHKFADKEEDKAYDHVIGCRTFIDGRVQMQSQTNRKGPNGHLHAHIEELCHNAAFELLTLHFG